MAKLTVPHPLWSWNHKAFLVCFLAFAAISTQAALAIARREPDRYHNQHATLLAIGVTGLLNCSTPFASQRIKRWLIGASILAVGFTYYLLSA